MLRMMWRMKIGPRLVCGFLIVSAACFAVGIRGLMATAETNKALDSANSYTLPSLIHLDTARSGILAIQRAERTLILALIRKDEKRCKELYGRIDEGWQDINTSLAAFTTMPMQEQEAALLAELQAALTAWRADHEVIIRHARAVDVEAAEAACMREWASSASRLNATLTRMMARQQELASSEREQAQLRYADTRIEMWSVVIGTTLGAIGLGLLMATSVTRPLGQTVAVLESVTRGDLTRRVAFRSRDEIGRIGAALNSAIDALQTAETRQHEQAERERRQAAEQHARDVEQAERERRQAAEQQERDREQAERERRQAAEQHARDREQAERERRQAAERDRAADELRAKVDAMLDVVNAAADGDLTQDVPVTGDDAIGRMGDGLTLLLMDLRDRVRAIAATASAVSGSSDELSLVSQRMGASSEETATRAGTVSAAAEQVSQSVQTVSAAVEEMGASIKEIAKNAADGARIASSAASAAQHTNATIAKLGTSSAEIGQVVKVITSIAQQTNLLALNATIEAARAGEAGKGFAVVAHEVKELAKETAKATEEIGAKIAAIQADTGSAVAAIREITEVVGQINDISSAIAAAVEEQTATTAEIARNVSEAARGSGEIAQNITSVAQAAQDTTAGATSTQDAAVALQRMASELQEMVGKFRVDADPVPAAAPASQSRRESDPLRASAAAFGSPA